MPRETRRVRHEALLATQDTKEALLYALNSPATQTWIHDHPEAELIKGESGLTLVMRPPKRGLMGGYSNPVKLNIVPSESGISLTKRYLEMAWVELLEEEGEDIKLESEDGAWENSWDREKDVTEAEAQELLGVLEGKPAPRLP